MAETWHEVGNFRDLEGSAMTRNRRRAVLSAIIIAAVVGWAGAGTASAGDKWDSSPVEVHTLGDKWD